MESSRVSSVRHLQTLYTVVVGIALTVALEDFSATRNGQPPLLTSANAILLLIAFIVTLVPFYHGALRHLDNTWIEKAGRNMKSGAFLGDFVILFVEGCLFLIIARQIGSPFSFGIGLILLLAIDVVWGTIAHFGFTHPGTDKAEWKWVQNNAITVLVALAFLIPLRDYDLWLAIGLLSLALLRTVVDYGRSWKFYFPAD